MIEKSVVEKTKVEQPKEDIKELSEPIIEKETIKIVPEIKKQETSLKKKARYEATSFTFEKAKELPEGATKDTSCSAQFDKETLDAMNLMPTNKDFLVKCERVIKVGDDVYV